MPGFNIGGSHKDGKLNTAEFNRKHRWRVSFGGPSTGPLHTIEWAYLQKAARPTFTVAPAEVHHDQEVAYFAGKQTWNELQLVFYDAVGGQGTGSGTGISQRMWDWVQSVIDVEQGGTVKDPFDYKTELKVQLYDGEGSAKEEWTLQGCWPTETNWNELDYQANDIALVNIKLRYDRAIKSK